MFDHANRTISRGETDDIFTRHIHGTVLIDVGTIVRPRVAVDDAAQFDQLVRWTSQRESAGFDFFQAETLLRVS